MGNYLEKPFPGLKNVIDGHIHMHDWFDRKKGIDFTHGLEEYRKVCGLKYISLAALASGCPPKPRDVANNIMCAFYKLLNKNTFAYGGYIYPSYPANADEMVGMDLCTQHDELMAIGFDGIKMVEGKPNLYKHIGKELDGEFFDKAFAKMEKEGTYILMHVADPKSFWTTPTEETLRKGWFYGDGTYPTIDELYSQIDNIMEKYPRLNLCIAHFFFAYDRPERLERMFEKYPNLTVDITPGGIMYIDFDKRPEYFKEFFTKYSDRICFGTDMDFPVNLEAGIWLCDRQYRFLATTETLKSFDDHVLTGIEIPKDCQQRIFSDNLLNKLGNEPKPINKSALKKYIEKYKHLIAEKELAEKIDELAKTYL